MSQKVRGKLTALSQNANRNQEGEGEYKASPQGNLKVVQVILDKTGMSFVLSLFTSKCGSAD